VGPDRGEGARASVQGWGFATPWPPLDAASGLGPRHRLCPHAGPQRVARRPPPARDRRDGAARPDLLRVRVALLVLRRRPPRWDLVADRPYSP
jgi:hypothetical protein